MGRRTLYAILSSLGKKVGYRTSMCRGSIPPIVLYLKAHSEGERELALDLADSRPGPACPCLLFLRLMWFLLVFQ